MIRLLLLNLGLAVVLTACGLFDSAPPEEESAQDTSVTQTDQVTEETQKDQEDQDYKDRVLKQEKALDQQEKETAGLTPASSDEATAEQEDSSDTILNLLLPADSEAEDSSAETSETAEADSTAETSDEVILVEEEEADPEEVVDTEAEPLKLESDAEVTTEEESAESEGTELAPATAVGTEFREVEEEPEKSASSERKPLSPEERAELLENIHTRLLKARDLGLPAVRDPRAEQLVSTVYFGFDDSRLGNSFQEQLIKDAPTVLEELENRGDLILQIEGHADERGDEEYNLALGHRRANTVHNLLKVYVTDPMTLRTISFGEEFPAIPDSNKEAWAKNRRVAFTFLLREP